MSTSSRHRRPAGRVSSPTPDERAKRRRLRIVEITALVLTVVVLVALWRVVKNPADGLASEASVTSSATTLGYSSRAVVDSGSATSPRASWEAADGVGAWVELSWPERHALRQVEIVRNPLSSPGVTDGFLSFGDGSFLQVALSTAGPVTVVPLTSRSVDRLRFTVSGLSQGARVATLAEILVDTAPAADDVVVDSALGGNAALDATVTQSPGGTDGHGLQDGSASPADAGVGTGWTTPAVAGAWVQLSWKRPRELSSVELVGGRTGHVAAATLTFADGARLPVGAVLADPGRPTVVAFMPRVTTSVRLTFDRLDGGGPIELSEVRAYQRGATPPRSPAAAPPVPLPLPAATCVDPPPAGTPLAVLCPAVGSVVDGVTTLRVALGSGYTSLTSELWPGDAALSAQPAVHVQPDASGIAQPTVDASGLPAGPFTVALTATGPLKESRTIYVQLYRRATAPVADVATTPAAGARTLVYAEEFNQQPSLSRTGFGADYSGGKPTNAGVEDFGDAIFSDPARGPATVHVVDGRYLGIDVAPSPPGFADPQGWGRTHVGGLLASARPGGSGFAAQYGYFEARMFAPAAPGTWPAFWMLPSDNLVAPTPVVAEIDAVELYGHDPRAACHTTHEYLSSGGGGVALCGRRFDEERDALAWHTYGVSITPTQVTYYIDGRVVADAPQVQGGGSPMFFLVDLALGGGWPIKLDGVQNRATLYVDYVRIYV